MLSLRSLIYLWYTLVLTTLPFIENNYRFLKLPIPLYYTKTFNHRFFVYCKIITIKNEGSFYYLFYYVVKHLIDYEKSILGYFSPNS